MELVIWIVFFTIQQNEYDQLNTQTGCTFRFGDENQSFNVSTATKTSLIIFIKVNSNVEVVNLHFLKVSFLMKEFRTQLHSATITTTYWCNRK